MKLKQLILWLGKAVQGMLWSVLCSSLIGILRVCVLLLFVWTCKQLIDVASHVSDGNMGHYTVLLIVVAILELLLSTWYNYQINRNDIRLKNKLRYNLFSHMMLSSWNGKERFHSGDVLNRIEEDVRLIAEAFSRTVPSVFVVSFQLVTAFIFLSYLDARMAWVIIFIMPAFFLLSKFYMKRMRRLTKEIRTTDSLIQAHTQEKIQYKILIQTLGQNHTVTSQLGALQDTLYGHTMKRINFTFFSRTLVMTGFATGYVAAFLWGVNGIYTGVISFGVMTAFLQLVGQVQRPIVDLGRYIPSLVQTITSAERLKELNDISLEKQGEQQIIDSCPGIYMEGVTFTYPDGDRQIIKDFTFDFKPGSRTAIVGETGAGKSTLIRLMLSLLYPQQGKIYLYNQKQKIEASPLTRCNLVYVPQGNTLLSGTIRDNLLLGNPNATDEQLKGVLTTAVSEFVYELPEGLDTVCGEHGAGLSEGQAQRICIARGLLRPGNVLLLDELSSSLDQDTERLLMERLVSQNKDKTLIFITHREMVVDYCEQVISLRKTVG